MSENKKAEQSAYEQQESRLSAQSAAFIKLLTQRGILGDADIDDDKIRQVQKDKKRRTYHNTGEAHLHISMADFVVYVVVAAPIEPDLIGQPVFRFLFEVAFFQPLPALFLQAQAVP